MPAMWSGNDAPVGSFRNSILGMYRLSDLQDDAESIGRGCRVAGGFFLPVTL